MTDLSQRFAAGLADLGVTLVDDPPVPTHHGVHIANVTLRRGASSQQYDVVSGPVVRMADAGRAGLNDSPRLVFTTFVPPKAADTFRRAGIQYLDFAGNAWITFGDVLIDVRGQRSPASSEGPARAAGGSLFSTGRAQVTFALLAWPLLWKAPQRELARVAGVSLGQTHNTLGLLAEAGYGPDHTPGGQTALLDLWAAAFPTGLAQKLTLARYHGPVDSLQKVHGADGVSSSGEALLSGEAAVADLLRPASLTVYVAKLDPRLPIRNRWRSDGPPNIVVRRKFWTTPPNATYDDDGLLAGARNAPWPLVYADLLASDDPRVRMAGKEWRNRFAGSEQHT